MKKNKLVSKLIFFIGLSLIILGIFHPLLNIDFLRDTHTWKIVARPLIIIGALFILLSKKIEVQDALWIMNNDKRSPILYLRSFKDDATLKKDWAFIWQNFGINETTEQSLAKLFNTIAPVIAIGKPNEKLPTLGAYRMYVKDNEWKETISELINKSKFIILKVGDTEGIWWEIQQVIKLKESTKLLLYYRYPYQNIFLPKKRKENYIKFRDRANKVFPKPLPENIGNSEFIYFDSEWNPIAASTKSSIYDLIRGWARGSEIIYFRKNLEPIFNFNGWMIPKLSYTITEYIFVPLFIIIPFGFLTLLIIILIHFIK